LLVIKTPSIVDDKYICKWKDLYYVTKGWNCIIKL
jgi:hypothetical protein